MTKYDRGLVFLIIIVALICYVMYFINSQSENPLQAEILVDGDVFTLVELNHPDPHHLINVTGPLGTSVVEVGKGKVRMLSSPCPDHLCMHMGYISESGQVIACIPNRIIIRITSGDKTLDAITR